MGAVLWIGSLLGAVCGVAHAVYFWRTAWRRDAGAQDPEDRRDPAGALYRGLWAVGLWTLFGTYLMVLWGVGTACYALAQVRASSRG